MCRRKYNSRFHAPFLAFALLLSASCAGSGLDAKPQSASEPAKLTDILARSEQAGTVVSIHTSRKIEFSIYKLAEPYRLAVEIPNISAGTIPNRQVVASNHVTAITIARFPRSNSIRLEFELVSDVNYKIHEKQGYLELFLSSLSESQLGMENSVPKGINDLNKLLKEVERLKAENLESRKSALKFEEENVALKKRLEEAKNLLEEANKLSSAMQSRVEFAEKQIDELQEKLNRGFYKQTDGPLGK